MQGVYAITNISTGARYIGSSNNIASRLSQHLAMLKKGKHHSIYLQRAWDKYGENSFLFKPLALLEDCEIIPTEQRLLDIEHTGETYNIAKDAVAWMKGRKHSKETLEAMSKSRIGNKSRTGVFSHWSKDKPPPSLDKLIAACKNPSKETRKKMIDAKKGKPSPNKGIKTGRIAWNFGMTNKFCKRGHEMTNANVYIRPDRKTRSCKLCNSLRKVGK
jgi:group I intron endonuclease